MIKIFGKVFVASVFAATFIANSAYAGIINWTTLGAPSGNTATGPGAVVTSQGGNLALKSRKDKQDNIWHGFGVTDIPTGEIGVGQSITIDFNSPFKVTSFQISYLWPKDIAMKDTVDETAKVSIFLADGSVFDYLLTAISATSANWSGFGAVSNLSPSDVFPNAGVWQVTNPFSDAKVSKIVFSPLKLGDGTSLDSDFSIVSVSVVSEPASIAIISLLLLALIRSQRRKNI